MLNIFPIDESYCQSFLKVINNEELTKTESEAYSRYNINEEEKAKQDASIIKNMIFEAQSLNQAVMGIEKRYDELMDKIDNAKNDLKILLENNHIDSVKTPYLEIKISKNPHSTFIRNEMDIPVEYIKETIVKTINKKQILDDLKHGVIIPGVELQQKTRIDIK